MVLHVVVRQAKGTLISIEPGHNHATSRLFGTYVYSWFINFLNRILGAYRKSQKAIITEPAVGAEEADD